MSSKEFVNGDVLIEVNGLKKSFGNHEDLKGITTDIKKGEVVAIIGPELIPNASTAATTLFTSTDANTTQ